MSEQPEALRLADELEAVPETGADPDLIQEAAAELRRLHAVNQELLEALQFIADHDLRGADLTVCGHMAHTFVGVARATIAKVEGQA
jgi:hypothetical protein